MKKISKISNRVNLAIILAAGDGGRMGGIDKIFYQIKKKPLIFYTILAFEKHPQIEKIIIVIKKADLPKFLSLIKKYKFKKIAAIVKGGKSRQASAFNGLKMAENLGIKSRDLILFHNGCNPLISQNEITKVIQAAQKYKAAALGQPAKDTIKEVTENRFIIRTIDRKKVFLAQTPQAIEYSLAKQAFEKALKEKFRGTDDVSLIERLGKRVKIVPANFKNIKVTYPEDLLFVKSQLKY